MWLGANLVKRWGEGKTLQYCYSYLYDAWAQLFSFLLGLGRLALTSKYLGLAEYLKSH